MASYVITGTSRGMGWEMLTQTSRNPDNKVIGLVRDKVATEKRVATELSDRKNITILQADLSDYPSLEKAAKDTAAVTGGSLDYLIGNAAMMSLEDAYDDVTTLLERKGLEATTKLLRDYLDANSIGTYYLFNFFTPLLKKGTVKKAAAVTSGHADLAFIKQVSMDTAVGYAASKAAQNVIVAKFSAIYAKEGMLFFSICPGVIDTGLSISTDLSIPTDKQEAKLAEIGGKFMQYAPDWKGPNTADVAAEKVLSLVHDATVETHAGSYVSHTRTDRWV